MIGFFAIVTVGIVGVWRARELATTAFVAALTAGLIALPQLATMVGASLPTLALGVGLPVAILVGIAAGRVVIRSERAREGLVRLAVIGRWVLAAAGLGAVAAAFAIAALTSRPPPGGDGDRFHARA